MSEIPKDETQNVFELDKDVLPPSANYNHPLSTMYTLSASPESPPNEPMEDEERWKSKYGMLRQGPSSFLQRKLSRGCKYFDSGDYNMAKAEIKKAATQGSATAKGIDPLQFTGEKIPRPDTVPAKKFPLFDQRYPLKNSD